MNVVLQNGFKLFKEAIVFSSCRIIDVFIHLLCFQLENVNDIV